MAGVRLVRNVSAVVLALLFAATRAAAAPDSPTVDLRFGARAPLDDEGLRLAQVTAAALLETAGIRVACKPCLVASCPADTTADVVLVQLLSVLKMTDREVSGETVRDQRSGLVTVLIYVPRIAELAAEVRGSSAGRSNPALASLEVAHLVGLTIAHEVGHGLGLSHARSGVMKARPSLDEIAALRASRLVFRDSEAARMRLTLLAETEGQMARSR